MQLDKKPIFLEGKAFYNENVIPMYIHCNIARGLHSYMFCKCLQYVMLIMAHYYESWNSNIPEELLLVTQPVLMCCSVIYSSSFKNNLPEYFCSVVVVPTYCIRPLVRRYRTNFVLPPSQGKTGAVILAPDLRRLLWGWPVGVQELWLSGLLLFHCFAQTFKCSCSVSQVGRSFSEWSVKREVLWT